MKNIILLFIVFSSTLTLLAQETFLFLPKPAIGTAQKLITVTPFLAQVERPISLIWKVM